MFKQLGYGVCRTVHTPWVSRLWLWFVLLVSAYALFDNWAESLCYIALGVVFRLVVELFYGDPLEKCALYHGIDPITGKPLKENK